MIVSEAFVALVFVVGSFLLWRFRRQVLSWIREFFSQEGSAFNLAVFRIIFYSTTIPLIILTTLSEGAVERYAALPKELLDPPTGAGLFARHVPISTTLVQWSYVILLISAALAAIGFLTRLASITFLVSGAYFLTIPQLYGKVSHYHIILWVAAVLAVSRTADVWSVDSLLRARRDARRGRALLPSPSRAYSRPLRMTWLFLALTYLGPGFWKYRDTGFEWARPTNMRGILYNKWYELGGWQPVLPVDKSDFLLTAGALLTMFFELGFVVLIWNRYSRILAACLGIFFHQMTYLTMKIGFWPQQVLYLSFVNWYRISNAFFKRRQGPLLLCYDGNCGVCRTIVTILARSALPGGIEFVTAQDAVKSGRSIGNASLTDMLVEMHLFTTAGTFQGFDAYRRLAWRVPILWPLLVLAYLPPVARIGRRVYGSVSSHRVCPITPNGETPAGRFRARAWRDKAWVLGPTAIGAAILVLGLAVIPSGVQRGWPIAVYPAFSALNAQRHAELAIEETRSDGTRTSISLKPCFSWMTSDRYAGIVRSVVSRARSGEPEALRSLLDAASRTCPRPQAGGAVALSFYAVTVATTPSIAGRVLSKQLLLREPLG